MGWKFLTICAVFLATARAQSHLRVCMLKKEQEICNNLARSGPVRCELVNNEAECAIKLAEGKADFGVFSPDDLMVVNHFYPRGLQVVAELRDNSAKLEQFKFQSVVVVHKNYTVSDTINLSGKGLCHPGFSRSESWNDRALKYLEKRVAPTKCEYPPVENEIANLRDYFKTGCRPGKWVLDFNLDKDLKRKYPQMCQLCDGSSECEYSNQNRLGQFGALDCLTSGKGGVAYVALHHAKNYFLKPNKNPADYRFLCENGSVMTIHDGSEVPCTWYKQPWNVILARETTAKDVLEKLNQTITDMDSDWKEKLRLMLFKEYTTTLYENLTTPEFYLSKAENMKMTEIDNRCGDSVRWCTVNDNELNKCNWTSVTLRSLGIDPVISCVPARSTFECFEKINKNEADIISIDSNYGHLARKKFKLSPVMFCQTNEDYNSFVVAVVRNGSSYKPIKNWSNLRARKACIPEYGGIAWLSFINTLRDHRLVSSSDCKYSEMVANFLSGACTPGLSESSHSLDNIRPRLEEHHLGKLCELCPTQVNGEKCEANFANPYYGDKGALDCLKSGDGDIALLEVGNIRAFINNNTVNESIYRVLCKNGSLSEYPGFNVDRECALSVTIDSEVVSRRVDDHSRSPDYDRQTKIQLLLLKIDEWLNIRVNIPRPKTLHAFGPFNGTENLLFKDTVVGLELPSSSVLSVQAYKDLFRHVDTCSSAAHVMAVVALVFVNFIFAAFI